MKRINYQTNEYIVDGRKAQTSSLGVVNYKDGNEFKEIDLTLIDKGDFWAIEKSIYNLKIPKYADDWFEFRNIFKENDHIIRSRPVVNHILGILDTEKNIVTYTDAFGDGIDMEISVFNSLVSRKIVIRKEQTDELNIDFEFEIPQELSFEEYDFQSKVKKNIILDSSLKSKKILFNGEQGSFIRQMRVWDESENKNTDFVESKFFEENGKKYLRKTISKEFLENAVYPVYADDDTGATLPGTASTDAAVGTVDWSNPDNIKLDDTNFASFIVGGESSAISYYLKATNFGFAIPGGATIDGIFVSIKRGGQYDDATSYVTDEHVRIVKADTTIGGENKADTVTTWPVFKFAVTYGANNDLWSEVWDDTDINDSDFGVVLSGDGVNGREPPINLYGLVYFIKITVYYTPLPGPADVKSVNGVAIADVKSINGVAKADVKSVNTIT